MQQTLLPVALLVAWEEKHRRLARVLWFRLARCDLRRPRIWGDRRLRRSLPPSLRDR